MQEDGGIDCRNREVSMDYETIKGERELWRGRQWAVTTHCIQGLGQWHYYVIQLDRLRKDETEQHTWLDHMSEKDLDIKDFIQAYCIACVYKGVRIKNIGELIKKARSRRACSLRYDRRVNAEARRMGYAKGDL